MATITSTGLGSGIDVEGIVKKLMEVERAPLTAMQTRQSKIEAQISAYGQIKSSVSTFRDAMNGLNSLDKYKAKKVQISDEATAKVSTNFSAIPGSYELQVKQLAQGQKLATKAFVSENEIVGTGNLVIDFGSYSNTTGFVANGSKTTQTIAIGAGQSSLLGIRDAINSAKVGVSASLLNDGTGYRLVLKSDETGTANGFKVSVTNDGDNNNADSAGLSLFAFDPANPPPTLQPGDPDDGLTRQVAAAKDALLVVDGVNVTKSSNVVNDVVQGVTMNLAKTTQSELPVKIDVAQDKDKIKEAINNFVKSYNDVRGAVNNLTAYDPATKKGGPLQGDYTARTIASNISRTLTSTIEGLTGKYGYLAQIGVALQKDGTLTVNDSKLSTAIDQNPDDVAALFSEVGRASDGLVKYASSTTKTMPGVYDIAVTQVGARSELTSGSIAALANTNGTLTNPYVINAANKNLSITVDGVSSGTIALTEKSYTTMGALTAELQSKINGDTSLRSAGKSLIVSYQGDTLKFSSSTYGANSSVQIANTSLGASLGIAGTGTAGQETQGTLGGKPATSAGQYLLGAVGTDMEGLKVKVDGGATGARGTVSFSHGYAFELSNYAEALLNNSKASPGALSTRVDGLNADLTRIKKREQEFEDRMTLVEKRLRAQFNAMDKIVGSMRTTSDFLTRQLKS